MSDFTLSYVYQLNDFVLADGYMSPPDADCGHASGTAPFLMKLRPQATPQPLHLTTDTATRDSIGNPVQLLTRVITLDGIRHPAGSRVVLNYRLSDATGFEGFSISIGQSETAKMETTAFLTNNPMQRDTDVSFSHAANLTTNSPAYREFACFTLGTKIKTVDGERNIEDIAVGDRVMTRDHGLQSVRWAGRRTVPAMGQMAPIKFDAGTLGCSHDLHVSPNHRMLISGMMAELLCGADEMLISAIDLVNDRNVSQVEGGFVTYVHIMFDFHEVIWANDCPSESFYAGENALDSLNEAQAAEIIALFPDLATNVDMQSLARAECQSYEASVISATL